MQLNGRRQYSVMYSGDSCGSTKSRAVLNRNRRMRNQDPPFNLQLHPMVLRTFAPFNVPEEHLSVDLILVIMMDHY